MQKSKQLRVRFEIILIGHLELLRPCYDKHVPVGFGVQPPQPLVGPAGWSAMFYQDKEHAKDTAGEVKPRTHKEGLFVTEFGDRP